MGKLTLYVEDFLASLEMYEETVKDSLKAEVKKCGLAIEKDAKRACPVKTNTLRDSIITDLSNIEKYECEVGTNVEYAPYVEYGTYKMKARPFLRLAYHKNAKKLVQKAEKILGGK